MKSIFQVLTTVSLLMMSNLSLADEHDMVCSQLINQSRGDLSYSVMGNFNHLVRGQASEIVSLPSASVYVIDDSEIAVYAGGVQLNKGGLNIQSANHDSPADMDCKVFYKVTIY